MPRAVLDIDHLPGHRIRRLQQIAVAAFLEETQAFGITPVQYAALATVGRQPGLDQRTLARSIGHDAATIGSVLDRLETRGLLRRSDSPHDRRVRLLDLSPAGAELVRQIEPDMLRAQERMLAPLPAAQRRLFMEMLQTLVDGNNALSRAPSMPPPAARTARAAATDTPRAPARKTPVAQTAGKRGARGPRS